MRINNKKAVIKSDNCFAMCDPGEGSIYCLYMSENQWVVFSTYLERLIFWLIFNER